jgi:hypothetical protein
MKHRRTIFRSQVSPVRIQQKARLTCYTELVFFHPMGSTCHVVHSGVSRVQNIDALFFNPGWA